ncbi:MAG: hypothetical protein JJT95_16810 [Pararhodobacter sp.]|nr:hypothetical protein [Pararhodobacter sp.]
MTAKLLKPWAEKVMKESDELISVEVCNSMVLGGAPVALLPTDEWRVFPSVRPGAAWPGKLACEMQCHRHGKES